MNEERAEGINTSFSYQYTDANNYSQVKTVVLAGRVSYWSILPYLDDGLYFIPSQVGLEDLQSGFLSYSPLGPEDTVWHKLEHCSVLPTHQAPTIALSAQELLRAFESVVWDEKEASKRIGLGDAR